MENTEREKILNRITQLIGKALEVKATHRANPPNVISSLTLNKGAFSEWKNSVESFILKVANENSHFYKNFQKEVKYESKNHVDVGVGILMAIRESVQQGDLFITDTNNSINAFGDEGGTGRSARGGSVVIGIPLEQIGIQHVKNPHKQYWSKLFGDFWKWFKEHITTVILGLVTIGLAYWFGWN